MRFTLKSLMLSCERTLISIVSMIILQKKYTGVIYSFTVRKTLRWDSSLYRFIQYPEWERTHNDHRVQLLAPTAPHKIQTLYLIALSKPSLNISSLGLWPLPRGASSSPWPLMVKNLSLIPNLSPLRPPHTYLLSRPFPIFIVD